MSASRFGILIFLSFLLLAFSSCKDNSKKGGSGDSQTGFAPPDGQTLFILGQADEQAMENYMAEVKETPRPAGFAFYTSLSNGAVQNDIPRYAGFIRDYDNTVLQLAIWTGERRWGEPGYYLDEIVAGKYDNNINALAEYCNGLNIPVYIRFGYEFDGWHNAYPPDKYIAAYQYFVDKMRDNDVTNVAYVWHSWGVDPYYGHDDFPEYYPELPNGQQATQELWYPGDDYVDWVGLSIFGTGWGDLSNNQVVQSLIQFADSHDKAVMLAETAAIKTSGQSNTNWVIPNTTWFQNVFSLINENDAVKAFTYINVDWEGDNPSSTWGDTRIQETSSSIQNYWLQNIESYIHANEDLYSMLGFEE